MTGRKISIDFSEEEVLVLFEWLHRLNESSEAPFIDQAEQRVAWDLEAALEAANPAYETRIFGPDRVKIQGRLAGLYRRYH